MSPLWALFQPHTKRVRGFHYRPVEVTVRIVPAALCVNSTNPSRWSGTPRSHGVFGRPRHLHTCHREPSIGVWPPAASHLRTCTSACCVPAASYNSAISTAPRPSQRHHCNIVASSWLSFDTTSLRDQHPCLRWTIGAKLVRLKEFDGTHIKDDIARRRKTATSVEENTTGVLVPGADDAPHNRTLRRRDTSEPHAEGQGGAKRPHKWLDCARQDEFAPRDLLAR